MKLSDYSGNIPADSVVCGASNAELLQAFERALSWGWQRTIPPLRVELLRRLEPLLLVTSEPEGIFRISRVPEKCVKCGHVTEPR